MTIHGSPGTLDVVVRMLAGLWGEGKAPISLELIPLAEGQVIDAQEFTIGCFPVRHRETDSFGFSDSPLRAGRAGIFGQTASRSSEYRTAPSVGSWREESGRRSRTEG